MSGTIRLILNGQMREISDLAPTTTLLQYLRLHARLTGTKEGCAEGDCGACTVAVATYQEEGTVRYQSINACIALLPTLDGREIVTVEYLKEISGGLNPVQKAMVDCHGAQCGFCTPGFVMALTTLVHNTASASDTEVQDSISGNLCRCTGYRPILDAARQANKTDIPQRQLPSNAALLKKIQRKSLFSYETAAGKFFAPQSCAEMADVLARYPEATLLAGGTDVGLWVTKMHLALPVIIYTGNITDLSTIQTTDHGLEIGAAVTYTDAFTALAHYDPTMEDLLRRFASLHIRNAGTVGGNIANGSPIGDGPPPLIALGAEIILHGPKGRRQIPLEDFFLDYKKQDRQPGEFLEKIIVPAKKATTYFKTYKVSKRFDQDISAVCAAFALDMDGDTITAARIAFGGMAATPKRAAKTEKALTGKAWNTQTLEEAVSNLDQDYTPLTDMRASATYRSAVAQNLLRRFYLDTVEAETETRVYNYGS